MRPGQNKRMRGRNPNRKGPNPLSRSYESNGPDVKIRGTAHHVAEKYLQLARDAQSSGDPVMAESYLQHAEHYFRLIAAAQAAQLQAQQGFNRPQGEADLEDGDDEDDFGGLPDRFASPTQPERFAPQQINAPQPNIGQQPNPMPYGERPSYNGNGAGGQDRGYGERQNQGGERNNQDRYERHPRGDRPFNDRQGSQRDNRNPNRDFGRGPRSDRNEGFRQDRFEPRNNEPRTSGNNEPRASGSNEPRGGLGDQPKPAPQAGVPENDAPSALPSFITAPVRPVPANGVEHVEGEGGREEFTPETATEEGGRFPLRQRRRRRPRPSFGEGGEPTAAASNGGADHAPVHGEAGDAEPTGD